MHSRVRIASASVVWVCCWSPPGAKPRRAHPRGDRRAVDVLNGKAFGDTGPYEKIWGKAYFAIDPAHPRNQVIADLGLAPRNAAGKVEFSADLFILKPKDPGRGNGVVFFDVVNRGRFRLLSTFSGAAAADDPTEAAHFGDGSLLNNGYTLVAVGWQFDVPDELIGVQAPIATNNGTAIKGWLREWFILGQGQLTRLNGPAATRRAATCRSISTPWTTGSRCAKGMFAARQLIPRADWQFGRMRERTPRRRPELPDAEGRLQARADLRAGLRIAESTGGRRRLAAVRDMASAMKYQPDIIAPGRLAYMYGVSQTGRALRQIIYEGFTIDEQGRKVFDAAFIKTGGASIARFNERFALVNSLGVFTETQFPFQYQMTTDPVTGKRDGMGARIPAGLEPKIFTFDTGSEYWDKGRLGALRHASVDGTADLPDGPNVRVYYVAGSRHGSGTVPAADGGGQFKTNPLNYTWARARVDGGARWLGAGGQGAAGEPPSAVCRWHDGAPPSAHVPGRSRCPLADERAGRLSLGRGHAGLPHAVSAVPGGRGRQRDGRHSPARAGSAARRR